jgi:transcriptional regulator NrdR family protein
MNCPHCNDARSKVLETRPSPHGVRRRHRCGGCGLTFASYNNEVSVANGNARTAVAVKVFRAAHG